MHTPEFFIETAKPYYNIRGDITAAAPVIYFPDFRFYKQQKEEDKLLFESLAQSKCSLTQLTNQKAYAVKHLRQEQKISRSILLNIAVSFEKTSSDKRPQVGNHASDYMFASASYHSKDG